MTIKPGEDTLGHALSHRVPPPEWLIEQVAPHVIEKTGKDHPGLDSLVLEITQTVIRRREMAGPFAGRWAQLRANPSAIPDGSALDEELAKRFFEHEDWIPVEGEDLEDLRQWTRDPVAKWWPVIEVVAEQLLERETLSGEEVRQVVFQHATEDDLREYSAQDVCSVVARYF